MKSKLAVVAVLVTLVMVSFAFTVSKKEVKASTESTTSKSEPVGGFVSESSF
jgi:hypothetical protein